MINNGIALRMLDGKGCVAEYRAFEAQKEPSIGVDDESLMVFNCGRVIEASTDTAAMAASMIPVHPDFPLYVFFHLFFLCDYVHVCFFIRWCVFCIIDVFYPSLWCFFICVFCFVFFDLSFALVCFFISVFFHLLCFFICCVISLVCFFIF